MNMRGEKHTKATQYSTYRDTIIFLAVLLDERISLVKQHI